MAVTNVSSSVLSIVASYTSGLDVFKSFRERRHRRRRRTNCGDKIDDDELRLSRSLRQGPEDIGREYQSCVQAAGEHFAVGDAVAQTALAEILLRLNSGLVSIISSYLNRNKGSIQLDYHSLTALSERSRVETICVLRQLYQRMMQARMHYHMQITQRQEADHRAATDEQEQMSRRKKQRPAAKKHTRTQGPMLARIVIKDSSQPAKLALVKPGIPKRKPQHRSGSASSSPSATEVSTPPTTPPTPEFPTFQQKPPAPPKRPVNQRSQTAPEAPKLRKKHSIAAVAEAPAKSPKPEALRATHSTPRLRAPPVPEVPGTTSSKPATSATKPELPQRPAAFDIAARRRKVTPTFYSVATASTKLGEIPLHKWAVPYDFDQASLLNKEAERSGWPMNEMMTQEGGGGEGRRKRFGLFRMFRWKGEE